MLRGNTAVRCATASFPLAMPLGEPALVLINTNMITVAALVYLTINILVLILTSFSLYLPSHFFPRGLFHRTLSSR